MDTTGMFSFGVLLVVLLYDVWVVARKGEPVSQFVTNCSVHPRIAFICGVLTCHFFGWMMFPK